MSEHRTVAKNALVMMMTQGVTWSLALLLVVFLPRALGVEAMGKYHFSSSLWAMVVIVVSFGMDLLLTKEIARNPERANELVVNSIAVRTGLFFVGWALVGGFLEWFHYPSSTRQVVHVMAVSFLLWEMIHPMQAALQGLERMEYISLSTVAGKAFNTFVCLALLFWGTNVLMVTAIGIPAAVLTLIIQIRSLGRFAPWKFRPQLKTMGYLLKAGIPYLLATAFLVIYMQFDIVILSLLLDDRAVGWYGVADQLFGTLLFVPNVMITAVFPVLSRRYAAAPESSQKVTQRSFDLLTVLSMPVGLGVLVIADPLVKILFGPAFGPSGPILALMGLVLILTSLNVLLGYSLMSMDRQNEWTFVMAVTTVLTLPLDWILIPWCEQWFSNGGLAGALSFLITEGGMLIVGIYLMPRGTLTGRNFWLAIRALLAGLIMVAGTWWLRDYFLAIPILVGAVIYLVAGRVFQLIQPEDWGLAKSMLQSGMQRFRPQTVVLQEDTHGN